MAAEGLPLLYTFRRCPYAIRARLVLSYAGIQVEHREVALRDKPAALLVASPKATVPVLQLPDGSVIDQSLDIMQWALRQSDPAGWLKVGDPQETGRLIALNDDVFKNLLDRYKYSQRHPELPMAAHRERALEALIRPLDVRLRGAPCLFGNRISLADAALFPFVRQFALVDRHWFDAMPLVGVQAWLQRWLDSTLFASVMGKAPVWHPST